MTLELLTKAQLQIINRKRGLGYPLDTAEKDYFLALTRMVLVQNSNQQPPQKRYWMMLIINPKTYGQCNCRYVRD
jgi:hypothetical protein